MLRTIYEIDDDDDHFYSILVQYNMNKPKIQVHTYGDREGSADGMFLSLLYAMRALKAEYEELEKAAEAQGIRKKDLDEALQTILDGSSFSEEET